MPITSITVPVEGQSALRPSAGWVRTSGWKTSGFAAFSSSLSSRAPYSRVAHEVLVGVVQHAPVVLRLLAPAVSAFQAATQSASSVSEPSAGTSTA